MKLKTVVMLLACLPLSSYCQTSEVTSIELKCEESIFSGVSSCQESLELLVETHFFKKPIEVTCQTTWEITYEKNKDKKTMRFDTTFVVPPRQGVVSKKFYVRQNIESTSQAQKPVSKTSCVRADLINKRQILE